MKEQLNELALFAGAGGGILGGMLLGWRTVCAVEIEPYPISVLIQRQNDGILPPFPIFDDVCTFDGKPWRGIIDVVSGGFPCQDISAAGKGAGITGERSGLWKEFARIIGEVRPRFAFVENSPVLTSRGLDVVLGDLAEMGYDARWGVFSGEAAGVPHLRERIYVVANLPKNSDGDGGAERKWGRSLSLRRFASRSSWEVADELRRSNADSPQYKPIKGDYRESECGLARLANGMADTMERLAATGNGQIPAVAALAWNILSEGLI